MVYLDGRRLRGSRAADHVAGIPALQTSVEHLRCTGIHVGDVERLARIDVLSAQLLHRELRAMRRNAVIELRASSRRALV